MEREEVLDRTILFFEYGSRAYGISNEASDHDLMGIAVEPEEYVLGLKKFEQYQSTNGVRSTAEDTDETIYSLRKWAGLAAKGNPTVQMALFASSYEIKTELGQMILDNRDAFISAEAGSRYLGYMQGQRLALMGQKSKRTNRPELVKEYGYDTKFAYHMLRLGFQGLELVTSGRIELPMNTYYVEYLKKVRAGEINLEEVLWQSHQLEDNLKREIASTSLPKVANYDRVNQLLIKIYKETWKNDAA